MNGTEQVAALAMATWMVTQVGKRRVTFLTPEALALTIAVGATGIAVATGQIELTVSAVLRAAVAYLVATVGHDKLAKPAGAKSQKELTG